MVKDRPGGGRVNVASLDIGSHTARLLVAERTGDGRLFRPLARDRAYIRLAEDLGSPGKENLSPEAMERAFQAVGGFVRTAKEWDAGAVFAVSTGVVRAAGNKEEFLGRLYERTGVEARLITGEEEARLTGKGVLHSLEIGMEPFVIFDLGGGSTEFLLRGGEEVISGSLPLGAMVLTRAFLPGDPPDRKDLEALRLHLKEVLRRAFPGEPGHERERLVVGTGGTVTTLAAMILAIEAGDIGPEKIHGMDLERRAVGELLSHMGRATVEERAKMKGLDRGRADVVLAGTMVVTAILDFFQASRLRVSFSDILEGILIDALTGGRDVSRHPAADEIFS